MRYRDRLTSFSKSDLLRKKRMIFAASFYVELMSYQVGELIHMNDDDDDVARGISAKKGVMKIVATNGAITIFIGQSISSDVFSYDAR